MPYVDHPASPLVPQLRGLHFFGFDAAPCSQRVAFALAEKGQVRAGKARFDSAQARHLEVPAGSYLYRHVSLIKHDNMTEAYAAIQPNMVVPALVHDGRLYIESMDIIAYLDEAFPDNRLIPADETTRSLAFELVELGKSLHGSVRHVTFNYSLGKLGRTDSETEARLRRLQRADSPEKLAEFYARFNRNEIEHHEYAEHLARLEAGFGEQEARLEESGAAWLTGDAFSIADIIWAIKVLRLTECGYPFNANYPLLAAWFERVRARPGFRQGVIGHHRMFYYAFRIKSGIENLLGRGIRADSRAAA